MRSQFWKIFGLSALLVALLAGSVLLVSFRLIRHHTVDLLVRDLERQARLLEPGLTACLQGGDPDCLNDLVSEAASRLEVRVTVIAGDGRVLADSKEDPEAMENHRFRPEVQEVLESRTGRSVRYSRTLKADMLYVARPLSGEDELLAVLRLSSFVRDIDRMMSGLRSGLARLAAALTLAAALAAFFVSRSLTRPVREMIRVSRRISRGDFEAKIYHPGRDELGELGRSLNGMTAQLRSFVENLRLQKEEGNGILQSMKDGLVLIDGEDRIRLANDSFKKMIGRDDPEGAYFWEVIRSSAFTELIGRARGANECLSGRVDLGGRVYDCSLTLLASPARVLAVLHDLTRSVELEAMKKDFVVSMSHELRTPLSAVKGYIETLEDEVSTRGRDYLRVLQRNTERLIKIVDDLLVLSALEGREAPLRLENVDLGSLAADSLRLFEPAARGKGLALRLAAGESPLVVTGDAFRLEQMFVNLLDNAVKYTDGGEVLLSLEAEPGRAVIRVRDTGAGIPPEHLPRLFERFYVVDPSRSRKMGGTGLGLAIVKHIVLLHGGEVSADSTPGRGSCFTVWLPRAPEPQGPTASRPGD